jgi:hypothetical protein
MPSTAVCLINVKLYDGFMNVVVILVEIVGKLLSLVNLRGCYLDWLANHSAGWQGRRTPSLSCRNFGKRFAPGGYSNSTSDISSVSGSVWCRCRISQVSISPRECISSPYRHTNVCDSCSNSSDVFSCLQSIPESVLFEKVLVVERPNRPYLQTRPRKFPMYFPKEVI